MNFFLISHAAKYGHHRIIDFLIRSQADLNVIDENCRTPLMIAISNKHNQVAFLDFLNFENKKNFAL